MFNTIDYHPNVTSRRQTLHLLLELIKCLLRTIRTIHIALLLLMTLRKSIQFVLRLPIYLLPLHPPPRLYRHLPSKTNAQRRICVVGVAWLHHLTLVDQLAAGSLGVGLQLADLLCNMCCGLGIESGSFLVAFVSA